MHFHLPKPLHGWRAFVGEVGIIVIGVLIALGAEQAVEAWQWHEKVAVLRQSLMGELANDRARWNFDLAGGRCALQEADRLDAWAQTRAMTAAPLRAIHSSQLLTMHTTNWTLAASSQTLQHFPVGEQLAFAALYAGIANRQVSIDQASDAADRITTLIPLASDPDARRELRESLGALKAAANSLVYNEAYMKRHFDAVGVRADASDFAADERKLSCA